MCAALREHLDQRLVSQKCRLVQHSVVLAKMLAAEGEVGARVAEDRDELVQPAYSDRQGCT